MGNSCSNRGCKKIYKKIFCITDNADFETDFYHGGNYQYQSGNQEPLHKAH